MWQACCYAARESLVQTESAEGATVVEKASARGASKKQRAAASNI